MPLQKSSKTNKRPSKKSRSKRFSPNRFSKLQIFVFTLIFASVGTALVFWAFAATNPPDILVALRDEKPLRITKDDSGKTHYSNQNVVFEVLSDNTLVCGDKATPDVLTTTSLTQAEIDNIVSRVKAAGIAAEPDQAANGQDHVGDLTWVQLKAGGVDKRVSIFDNPDGNQFAQKVRVIAKDICRKATKQIERDKAPKTKELALANSSSGASASLAWLERQVFSKVSATGTENAADVTHINNHRATHGLRAYSVATDLYSVATRQAQAMAARHTIYHNPYLGSQVSCWKAVGENVGMGGTESSIFGAFLNSAPHHANIHDLDFTQVGVGTARDDKGVLYISQVFRQPSSCGSTTTTTTTTTTSPYNESGIPTYTCTTKPHPTVQRGSSGNCVKHLQWILHYKYKYNLGAYGPNGDGVDGSFGTASYNAVRDFQSKHGLSADGIVGPKTWDALH